MLEGREVPAPWPELGMSLERPGGQRGQDAGAQNGAEWGVEKAWGQGHLQRKGRVGQTRVAGVGRGSPAGLACPPHPRHVGARAASDEEAEGGGGQAARRDSRQGQGARSEERGCGSCK